MPSLAMGLGLSSLGVGGGVVYDPDALAYFAAMTVEPDDARKSLINDFIVGLKGDGVWSRLDLVYILASHNAQAARLNAKTPGSFAITEQGTVTFTTDRGYTSSGSPNFLDTNFNPTTAGGNWARDSASLFSWVNNVSAGTRSTVPTWGTSSSNSALQHMRSDVSNNNTSLLNQGSTSQSAASASALGSVCASRTGASVVNIQEDGAASGSTSTIASIAVPSQSFWLLRTGAVYNIRDRVALATAGGGLTGTQMTALHNRSSTFLTAIGAN